MVQLIIQLAQNMYLFTLKYEILMSMTKCGQISSEHWIYIMLLNIVKMHEHKHLSSHTTKTPYIWHSATIQMNTTRHITLLYVIKPFLQYMVFFCYLQVASMNEGKPILTEFCYILPYVIHCIYSNLHLLLLRMIIYYFPLGVSSSSSSSTSSSSSSIGSSSSLRNSCFPKQTLID